MARGIAMEDFEEAIKKAVDRKIVANAVLVASRKGGSLPAVPISRGSFLLNFAVDPDYRYEKTIGKLSIGKDAPDIQLDSVFWIASCTKVVPHSIEARLQSLFLSIYMYIT
jgi:hypothetical protein